MRTGPPCPNLRWNSSKASPLTPGTRFDLASSFSACRVAWVPAQSGSESARPGRALLQKSGRCAYTVYPRTSAIRARQTGILGVRDCREGCGDVRGSGVPELVVLSENDVRGVLALDELAESLTVALIALSEGSVSVPARIAARSPSGLLGAMPGYVPGLGLAAKLVSVYPHNSRLGQPAHQAIIAVFDEVTGAPSVVMGATYITAIRTAMTAALVAQALARPRATSLAIIGAGVQAEAHLEAFNHLTAPADIRIASRHFPKAVELAERHRGAVAAPSVREAVDGADLVCCCTDAAEPVLADEWIGPGTHVSSVGSGPELPTALLSRAQLFVESRAATAPPPSGAVELEGVDPESLTEVGEVLAGRSGGRLSAESVTVFKSTGHAVEDVAAASVVMRLAGALGAGTAVAMGA